MGKRHPFGRDCAAPIATSAPVASAGISVARVAPSMSRISSMLASSPAVSWEIIGRCRSRRSYSYRCAVWRALEFGDGLPDSVLCFRRHVVVAVEIPRDGCDRKIRNSGNISGCRCGHDLLCAWFLHGAELRDGAFKRGQRPIEWRKRRWS